LAKDPERAAQLIYPEFARALLLPIASAMRPLVIDFGGRPAFQPVSTFD